MADDSQKTEEPSEKRKQDALKKGDIAKSPEVTAVAMLLGGTIVIAMWAGPMALGLLEKLKAFMEASGTMPMDGASVVKIFAKASLIALMAVIVPFVIFVLMAIVGNLVQAPFVFTPNKIMPDLKKISPISGAKKIFGTQGWVNLAKALAKMVVVSVIIGFIVWPERDQLIVLMKLEPAVVMGIIQDMAVRILLAVSIVFIAVAALDLVYQKHQRHERLKMSKQELKDEFKQSEGDPQVKAKLRQLRQEKSRQRMMAEIPDAAVVITNPTHFAVALKYESETMAAPICVAKGVDALAFKIREVAEEHGVPIVENPPLARALHATVELEDPVPAEHYKAVAQVIGYVWRMKPRKGRK